MSEKISDKQVIAGSPEGATHAAFSNYSGEVKYLKADEDVINSWSHWTGGEKYNVDYDLTVVFNNIRSLKDIELIAKQAERIELLRDALSNLVSITSVNEEKLAGRLYQSFEESDELFAAKEALAATAKG